MQIHVNGLSLSITFDLDPKCKIKALKDMVRAKFVTGEENLLVFLNDKDLFEEDDDSTLEDCGIKSGATLQIGLKERFVVDVRVLDYDRTYYIDINCYHTVGKLKKKIEKRAGIPVEEQILISEHEHGSFPPLANKMANERTLLSYGCFNTGLRQKSQSHNLLILLPTFSSINTCTRPLPFFDELLLKYGIRPDKFSEEYSDAIPPLVFRRYDADPVLEKFGIHPDKLSEVYSDDIPPLLIRHYDADPAIEITFVIPNLVDWCPKRAGWLFPPKCKIKHLMEVAIIGCKENIILFLNSKDPFFKGGKDLFEEDYDSTFEDCGIESGATLQIGFKERFLVCVFGWWGKTYTIDVDCYHTVGKLKKKIEKRANILVKEQELEYNGFPLRNDRTLLSYGIFRTTYNPNPSQHRIGLGPTYSHTEACCPLPIFDDSFDGLLMEAFDAGILPNKFTEAYADRIPHPIICPHEEDPSAIEITFEIPDLGGWQFPVKFYPTHTLKDARTIIIHDFRTIKYLWNEEDLWDQELWDQTYIHNKQFVLVFNGQQLVDESKTLDDYGIKDKCHMRLCKMTLVQVGILGPEHGQQILP